MKASREYKRHVDWLRKVFGKKNGVVRGVYFDSSATFKEERSSRYFCRRDKHKSINEQLTKDNQE